MKVNFTPALNYQHKNVNFTSNDHIFTEPSTLEGIKKKRYHLKDKSLSAVYYNINKQLPFEPELASLVRRDYAVSADYLLRTDEKRDEFIKSLKKGLNILNSLDLFCKYL